jgi:hypothetical protein
MFETDNSFRRYQILSLRRKCDTDAQSMNDHNVAMPDYKQHHCRLKPLYPRICARTHANPKNK